MQFVCCPCEMQVTTKYTAVNGAFSALACGVCVLAFATATETFSGAEQYEYAADAAKISVSQSAEPSSPLLGRSAPQGAEASGPDVAAAPDAPLVQVIDAVNMRAGPSSSQRVIKVQLEGAQLRVAARDGGWVEVVEPDTGLKGWVYSDYVKGVEPTSRRADIGGRKIE